MNELDGGGASDDAGEGGEDWRARSAMLEQRLKELEQNAAEQVRLAELKAEALRAGIVDLDGLRLLEPEVLRGGAASAADIVLQLRKDKPWLFPAGNSSSRAVPPAATPPRRKLATEMSLEEWRSARAELLRRR